MRHHATTPPASGVLRQLVAKSSAEAVRPRNLENRAGESNRQGDRRVQQQHAGTTAATTCVRHANRKGVRIRPISACRRQLQRNTTASGPEPMALRSRRGRRCRDLSLLTKYWLRRKLKIRRAFEETRRLLRVSTFCRWTAMLSRPARSWRTLSKGAGRQPARFMENRAGRSVTALYTGLPASWLQKRGVRPLRQRITARIQLRSWL